MAIAGGEGRAASVAARLNWRLYRLYLAPIAIAALVAAFSLGARPAPRTSTLAPEAFEGARALALLSEMARLAPERSPGGAGDARLGRYLERWLRSTGGPSGGGYAVRRISVQAPTSIGSRRLTVLVGSRAGATSRPPIVLIAHRDALRSPARAQLSGTAALLELAAVLSKTETTHPLQVVFSDGGSAGAEGAAAYLASQREPIDAAIVLGDLGGRTLRTPLVQPYSDGFGSAPETLRRTLSSALAGELRLDAGAPGLFSQLAHLAFPLSIGEAGLFQAAGVPTVSVSLAGEAGPTEADEVSGSRLQAVGRAVLSAFYALDASGEVPRSPQRGLALGGNTVPSWALRLLIGSLLLAPLAVTVDALTRDARRGERLGRAALPALTLAASLFAVAVTVRLLGLIGLPNAPAMPVGAAALPAGIGAALALLVAVAALALGLRAWWRGVGSRRLRDGLQGSAAPVVAAIAIVCALGVVVWIANPYAVLLLAAAPHLWLLLASREHRPDGRTGRLAVALAPLLPLGLLILYYASSLHLGPRGVVLEGLAMLAGGHVGLLAALAWSVALGALGTVAALAALPRRSSSPSRPSREATEESAHARVLQATR